MCSSDLAMPHRQVVPHIYSFRTSQHEGRPHPVLSKSTSGKFFSDLSPEFSLPTELETRLHPALRVLVSEISRLLSIGEFIKGPGKVTFMGLD